MPERSAVLCEEAGGLATLRLNGHHGNAINEGLVRGLLDALDRIQADPGIRGVLLAGSGRLFCPGLDLQDLGELDRPSMDRFMAEFGRCILRLYELPRPLVAALHGHAIAGGCVLAMTADWRVLARGALIGLNEVKVGVPLPWGVAQMMREAIAPPRLEEICLFGRNYSGEEALSAGLAHELAEPGGTEEVARARLAELAEKDGAAFEVTKRYLRHAAVERIRAGEERLRAEWLDGWFSPSTRDRIAAIVAGLRRS